MTDDMMNLRSLLEKSADADLLREMIGYAAERLMALKVEGACGAGHGERTAGRMVGHIFIHNGDDSGFVAERE